MESFEIKQVLDYSNSILHNPNFKIHESALTNLDKVLKEIRAFSEEYNNGILSESFLGKEVAKYVIENSSNDTLKQLVAQGNLGVATINLLMKDMEDLKSEVLKLKERIDDLFILKIREFTSLSKEAVRLIVHDVSFAVSFASKIRLSLSEFIFGLKMTLRVASPDQLLSIAFEDRRIKTITDSILSKGSVTGGNSKEYVELIIRKCEDFIPSIDTIIKTIESLDTVSPVYFLTESTTQSTLTEYARIGEIISRNPYMNKLKSVIFRQKVNATSKAFAPFVVICAPSGTGKTNSAFAFPGPALYFLSSHSANLQCHSQPIYDCFRPVNDEFWKVISIDFKKYSNDSTITGVKGVLVAEVSKYYASLYSVGFIVSLVQAALQKWNSTGRKDSFLQIQANLESLAFEPLRFSQAKLRLRSLFQEYSLTENDTYLLPIFFDECHKVQVEKVGEENELKNILLTFTKSIVQCMHCTPILMGTNGSAAEFVAHSGLSPPSSSLVTDPWCLIVYDLPGLDDQFVDHTVQSLKTLLEDMRLNNIPGVPSDDLVEFLFKYLKREPPVLFHYFVSYIQGIPQRVDNAARNDLDFLNSALENALLQFCNRKGNNPIFKVGQLAYVMSYYWKGSTVELNEKVHGSDSLIHGHMAYLDASADDEEYPFYCTISPIVDSTRSIFRHFTTHPITGLVCTGLYSINRNTEKRETPLIADKDLSGLSIELSLACAMMFASKAYGLSGAGIESFLSHLFIEYDDDKTLIPVYCDIDFMERFKDLKIPYCAPMATAKWGEDFVKDLSRICPAEKQPLLGTIDPMLMSEGKKSEFDTLIRRPDEWIVLVGKLLSKNVNKTVLDDLVEGTFSAYDSNLFLLLAPSFAKSIKFYHEGYCAWKFERFSTIDIESYIQVPFNDLQKTSASKHILLIELDTV